MMARRALWRDLACTTSRGRLRLPTLLADAPALIAVAVPAVLTNIATPVANAYVTRAMAPFGDSARRRLGDPRAASRPSPSAPSSLCRGPWARSSARTTEPARSTACAHTLTQSLLVTAAFTAHWLGCCSPLLAGPIAAAFHATGETARAHHLLLPLRWRRCSCSSARCSSPMPPSTRWGARTISTALNWGRATLGTMPFVAARRLSRRRSGRARRQHARRRRLRRPRGLARLPLDRRVAAPTRTSDRRIGPTRGAGICQHVATHGRAILRLEPSPEYAPPSPVISPRCFARPIRPMAAATSVPICYHVEPASRIARCRCSSRPFERRSWGRVARGKVTVIRTHHPVLGALANWLLELPRFNKRVILVGLDFLLLSLALWSRSPALQHALRAAATGLPRCVLASAPLITVVDVRALRPLSARHALSRLSRPHPHHRLHLAVGADLVAARVHVRPARHPALGRARLRRAGDAAHHRAAARSPRMLLESAGIRLSELPANVERKPVIIFGAGQLGVQLLEALRRAQRSRRRSPSSTPSRRCGASTSPASRSITPTSSAADRAPQGARDSDRAARRAPARAPPHPQGAAGSSRSR